MESMQMRCEARDHILVLLGTESFAATFPDLVAF